LSIKNHIQFFWSIKIYYLFNCSNNNDFYCIDNFFNDDNLSFITIFSLLQKFYNDNDFKIEITTDSIFDDINYIILDDNDFNLFHEHIEINISDITTNKINVWNNLKIKNYININNYLNNFTNIIFNLFLDNNSMLTNIINFFSNKVISSDIIDTNQDIVNKIYYLMNQYYFNFINNTNNNIQSGGLIFESYGFTTSIVALLTMAYSYINKTKLLYKITTKSDKFIEWLSTFYYSLLGDNFSNKIIQFNNYNNKYRVIRFNRFNYHSSSKLNLIDKISLITSSYHSTNELLYYRDYISIF
jgi:hypothetical protein